MTFLHLGEENVTPPLALSSLGWVGLSLTAPIKKRGRGLSYIENSLTTPTLGGKSGGRGLKIDISETSSVIGQSLPVS